MYYYKISMGLNISLYFETSLSLETTEAVMTYAIDNDVFIEDSDPYIEMEWAGKISEEEYQDKDTIHTLEEILNDFFYDWVDTDYFPMQTEEIYGTIGFGINKTSVYMQDGEYWLSYKTSTSKVSPQAFFDLQKLMMVLENSINAQDKMKEFAESWMGNDFNNNQEYKDFMSYIRSL